MKIEKILSRAVRNEWLQNAPVHCSQERRAGRLPAERADGDLLIFPEATPAVT
jgi:hypothetical protein